MTQSDQTRDSFRRSLRSRIAFGWCLVGGLGGGFECDAVAQGGQLGDVVTHAALDVDAQGVVVGPEVVETREWIGQQVPDDDQDRAGDRNQGLELAAAFDDPSVALAEEGVGSRGRGRSLTERALEIRVALTRLAAPVT